MDFFTVRVQTQPFDIGEEMNRLSAQPTVGAVVSFSGLVRDFGDCAQVTALELEHYPGMTEKILAAIIEAARQRWVLDAVTLIHRVGGLPLGEPIVLVLTASAHRRDAFAACEFIMDYLKTEAPFWKKEHNAQGSQWVDAKTSDATACDRGT